MIVVTPTPLDGVVVVEPTVFGDDRGFFMESFNSHDFAEAGLPRVFAQDTSPVQPAECYAVFIISTPTGRESWLELLSVRSLMWLLISVGALPLSVCGLELSCRPRTKNSYIFRRAMRTASVC